MKLARCSVCAATRRAVILRAAWPCINLAQGRRDLLLGKLALLHAVPPRLEGYRLADFPSFAGPVFWEDVTPILPRKNMKSNALQYKVGAGILIREDGPQ